MSGRVKGRPGEKSSGDQEAAWARWLQGKGPPPEAPAALEAERFLQSREGPPPELPGPLAAALATVLADAGDVTTLARLADAAPRDLAKAARRALHELRRKGIPTPERRPEATAPAQARGAPGGATGEAAGVETRDPDAADRRATLTAPFGAGERVVVFRFRGPGDRRLHAGVATLSDRLGLLDLQLLLGKARLYSEMARGAAERVPAAEVPFALAAARVTAAAERSRAAGRLVPEHFGVFRSLVRPEALPPARHPADALPVLPAPDAAATFPLFEAPELRSWLPAEEALQALAKRFEQIGASPVLLTEAQRRERYAEAYEQALFGLWTEKERQALALRLQDAAHVAAAHQRAEIAGRLLGIRTALLATPEPHRLPFCRQLLLRPFLQQLPPEVLSGLSPDLAPGSVLGAPGGGREGTADGGLLWTGHSPGGLAEGGLLLPGHHPGAPR